MKKTLTHTARASICAIIAAASISAVSAFDFGGALTNNTKFSGNTFDDFKCDQVNDASLWIRAPFNNSGTCYFTAEAIYEYENDFATETTTNSIDCDLFKFAFSKQFGSNKFSLAAGRFSSFDKTGFIFSQAADGLLVKFDMPRFTIAAYGAYTGLLNAQTVTILTPNDEAFSFDSDKLYDFTEKYAVGSLSITFPYILLNQTISAQFFGTFRMEDASYTRMYGTLGFNGSLIPSLFYNLTSTIGMTSYDGADYDISNLSVLSLTLYPTKKVSIGLDGVYASGEQGPFKSFIGFTSQTATNALDEPQYTGLIRGGISATFKPVNQVFFSARGDIVFDAHESVEYDGFQYQADAIWQIVSDVQIGATFYQYKDNDNSDRDKSCVQLRAVITF